MRPTPIFQSKPSGAMTGYHSNRRVPSDGALAMIQPLYADMLAEESRREGRSDSAAASLDFLQSVLVGRKTTYDEFIFALNR